MFPHHIKLKSHLQEPKADVLISRFLVSPTLPKGNFSQYETLFGGA